MMKKLINAAQFLLVLLGVSMAFHSHAQTSMMDEDTKQAILDTAAYTKDIKTNTSKTADSAKNIETHTSKTADSAKNIETHTKDTADNVKKLIDDIKAINSNTAATNTYLNRQALTNYDLTVKDYLDIPDFAAQDAAKDYLILQNEILNRTGNENLMERSKAITDAFCGKVKDDANKDHCIAVHNQNAVTLIMLQRGAEANKGHLERIEKLKEELKRETNLKHAADLNNLIQIEKLSLENDQQKLTLALTAIERQTQLENLEIISNDKKKADDAEKNPPKDLLKPPDEIPPLNSGAKGGFKKITTLQTEVITWMKDFLPIPVITLALILVGYRMVFKAAEWKDVSPIFWGGIIIAIAATLASLLIPFVAPKP